MQFADSTTKSSPLNSTATYIQHKETVSVLFKIRIPLINDDYKFMMFNLPDSFGDARLETARHTGMQSTQHDPSVVGHNFGQGKDQQALQYHYCQARALPTTDEHHEVAWPLR